MAIPAKGSRRVKVDDVSYDWRIRKQPTYSQGAFGSAMSLAVQAATEGPRSVLVVNLRVSRPDNWLTPHQTAVKPAMVRAMIRRALEQGWIPTRAGGPFKLEFGLIRDRP